MKMLPGWGSQCTQPNLKISGQIGAAGGYLRREEVYHCGHYLRHREAHFLDFFTVGDSFAVDPLY
jgi:hypothetical protein